MIYCYHHMLTLWYHISCPSTFVAPIAKHVLRHPKSQWPLNGCCFNLLVLSAVCIYLLEMGTYRGHMWKFEKTDCSKIPGHVRRIYQIIQVLNLCACGWSQQHFPPILYTLMAVYMVTFVCGLFGEPFELETSYQVNHPYCLGNLIYNSSQSSVTRKAGQSRRNSLPSLRHCEIMCLHYSRVCPILSPKT